MALIRGTEVSQHTPVIGPVIELGGQCLSDLLRPRFSVVLVIYTAFGAFVKYGFSGTISEIRSSYTDLQVDVCLPNTIMLQSQEHTTHILCRWSAKRGKLHLDGNECRAFI